VFTDAQWTAATHALARQLRHAAALLDGRMPEDIDETLDALGLSLFPGPRELTTTCSCPDVANPCKHVAAVHYTLAQTFDADPFLLPTLRGRDRKALLAALCTARTGIATQEPNEPTATDSGRPISTFTAQSLFNSPSDPAAIVVHPAEPNDPVAALRRLGPPPGLGSITEMENAVRHAATQAWLIAQDRQDDPLLEMLRERGSATTTELANALGKPTTAVRLALRPLIADGLVHRTGHASSTRYHT
jgi:uncharacterized Zn finger protein